MPKSSTHTHRQTHRQTSEIIHYNINQIAQYIWNWHNIKITYFLKEIILKLSKYKHMMKKSNCRAREAPVSTRCT